MRLVSFHDWIRRIYATQDDELDCNAVFDLLPTYVDMEIAGEAPSARFCEVEHHLRQCPYCFDLYLGLRDAALLESREATPEAVPIERCRAC
jgi:predicted anti-sigma-YlaC factor YlaD